MNASQKELILALREQGMTYKNIAARIGVKETYARTICSRANQVHSSLPPKGFCKSCGAELVHVEGFKCKQFCSDACRYKWHNRLKMNKLYVCYCEECGTEFISHGYPSKRFCSRACQTQARRKGKQNGSKEI